ncbi:MAG: hypothetical protein R2911_01220 [Caldilineaceae bacterium]
MCHLLWRHLGRAHGFFYGPGGDNVLAAQAMGTLWSIPAARLLFVLGWNLIGAAFRDALDPKLR